MMGSVWDLIKIVPDEVEHFTDIFRWIAQDAMCLAYDSKQEATDLTIASAVTTSVPESKLSRDIAGL